MRARGSHCVSANAATHMYIHMTNKHTHTHTHTHRSEDQKGRGAQVAPTAEQMRKKAPRGTLTKRLLPRATGRQVKAYISYVYTYNTYIAAERNWATEVVAMKEQVMWLLTSDLLAANVPPIVGSRDATAVFLFPRTRPLNSRNKNSHN